MLAQAIARGGSNDEHNRAIWRLVAFLGRYGHQPADTSLALTVTALRHLADSVGELLREEGDAVRDRGDG